MGANYKTKKMVFKIVQVQLNRLFTMCFMTLLKKLFIIELLKNIMFVRFPQQKRP